MIPKIFVQTKVFHPLSSTKGRRTHNVFKPTKKLNMKMPTVRLVFDRKHVATRNHKGLVQIEISFAGARKFASTGVRLYADQWKNGRNVVNREDMTELNEWLTGKIASIERRIRENQPFTWEKFESIMDNGGKSDNFLEFIEKAMNERNDIRQSTKKTQRKLLGILREYGRIKVFGDLTRQTITDFDNWLHGRQIRKIDTDGREYYTTMRQQSLRDYHKFLKSYINIAIRQGLMEANPYAGMRFKRGESEPDRYLSDDELTRLEAAPMPNGSLARAKDLFLFQCYTGLSYADLAAFDFTKARESDGDYIYSGRRVKTGEPFYFILLPKAIRILEKYKYKMPVISNAGLNQQLKKVATAAGISKPIATHWARRTAAMIFANHGVRMEVVAKILGHSSTITTQKFYASITGKTVAEEMKKAGLL